MRRALAIVFVVLAAGLAQASELVAERERSGLAWMSGDEIRQEFSGRKLQGIYPSKRIWREEIFADGSTDYKEGTKHWKGQWSVNNDTFCFEYPVPGAGGCFRVTRISANCFELYEVTSQRGQAELPPAQAEYWNGRMWHATRPTTCEATPSV